MSVTPSMVPAGDNQGDRVDLLADVAEMYYVEGLDQRQIAESIGLSRSNISRLLTEARRKGIVEIRIRRPLGRTRDLEAELVAVFGLREARVLASRPGQTSDAVLAEAGALGARLLLERELDGRVIGVAWGTGLEAVVSALGPQPPRDVDVVQLLGGLAGPSSSLSGERLGQRLADLLGGRFTPMLAPATIVSRELAAHFRRQPGVADVLERGRNSDLAIVGIGAVGSGSSRQLFQGAGLTATERKAIEKTGAVGDICARLYTIDGEICRLPIDGRVAAIDLEELRKIPEVIGIACGVHKRDGVLGALRGRFVDVLVTDEVTALAVLEAAGRD